MATLMCVRCDTGAPRCLSVLTAEKRDFPAQVREDGPCQDVRPKGPFRLYGQALGGVQHLEEQSPVTTALVTKVSAAIYIHRLGAHIRKGP